MKKLINSDIFGGFVFAGIIFLVIGGMMVFSCIRDYHGVRLVAPAELTECSTCSP
jgi:hypothetical protein